MHRHGLFLVKLSIALSGAFAVAQVPNSHTDDRPIPQAMKLDLTQTFHTRSRWRFVVTEGKPTQDYGGMDAPGALTVCLHKGSAGPCVAGPVTMPLRRTTLDNPVAWEPHYLFIAKAVYPRGIESAPLLLVETGSLLSGDSDEIVTTQLVAYDAEHDIFRRVFGQSTGHNNNQEIRFVTEGPLQGSVISAEPQQHLPYGFWMVVSQQSASGDYKQVLRYGSSTRYNDGNPLAVIDSEMPNIEQRLGLWKPGDPLPVPKRRDGKTCLRPVLRHSELWCS
jgi:hypothetical protein